MWMVVVRGLWKTKTDRISMQISLLMSGLRTNPVLFSGDRTSGYWMPRRGGWWTGERKLPSWAYSITRRRIIGDDKIEVRSPVEEADPVPCDGDRGVLRDGPGDDPPLLAPLHGVQTHEAADRYRYSWDIRKMCGTRLQGRFQWRVYTSK